MAKLKPNAETFRIRALAYLARGDLALARLEIRKALEMEPHWESVRLTAATIDYFSALSPAVLPNRVISWPEPVDWTLVKQDDDSLARLRGAAKVFRELAQKLVKEKDRRQMLESWCLACLANDPDQQEEAIEYCREILKADRTHFRAIAWATTRNFDIDLAPSEKALEKLVTDGTAAIPHILALNSCYLASQKADEAINLLEHTKPIFQRDQADALWASWHVQLLVFRGDPQAALAAAENSGLASELRGAQTLTLRALAGETDEWRLLVQHLESSYEETGDPIYLLESCEVKVQRQDWAYVADRAKQLVKELGTGKTLRFAAIAAYNDKRFDLCLGLLDDHRELFRLRKLPSDLRRLRILCKQALGILPEAITEAEALAIEEPKTENLLSLAQLYFEKGDFKGLTIIARKLCDHPDLKVEPSLRIARLVQWEDQGLATSLWRKAVSQDLPDSLVGEALALGYQLGLDKELGPLLPRMAELGRQGFGGIQVATIHDLISLARGQPEHWAKLDEAYRKGIVPIHVISEQLNWTLVDLYHQILAENEAAPNPVRQSSLLARHGGRALMPGFPDSVPEWRLNLDVTAILLAAHLGILAEAETAFKPLRIPANLIPALIRMRDRKKHHQPSRLQACRETVDLAERGSLKVAKFDLPPSYPNVQLVEERGEEWVALFESACVSEGYLVDFLPLMKQDLSGPPSALPEDASQYLVNCRAVVEALWEQGPLSSEEYDNALRELGDEGRKVVSEAVPGEGSCLYCHANIPEVLAAANLLHIACERFQVYVEQREFDQARQELKEYERRLAVAEWLGNLINRVRKGIDDRTYEIIPAPFDKAGEVEEVVIKNPDLGCLETLLRFEAQVGDVIWADDRYLNSYLRRDGVPIIGINEILKSLVSAGALEVGEYYGQLNRLRATNARFIPIQAEEILYQLRQARMEGENVIETQGLSVLRRHVAAGLWHGDVLQRPPMPEGAPNEQGEVVFIVGLGRAIIEALAGVWAVEEDDESTCRARAEWLLSNLYIDHLGLFRVTSLPGSEQNDRYLAALTLAALISRSFFLESGRSGDGRSPRSRYLDWLFDRVLRKRFDADPHLVVATADILKKTLLSVGKQALENGPDPIVFGVLQEFYEDLPEPIRNELWQDTDFMASMGITPLTAITIDDLKFDPDDFFGAASEAVNGREATFVPLGLDKEITFKPFDDPSGCRGIFCFEHPGTGDRQAVGNEDLELLLESPMAREEVLRRNRRWFDCSDQTFDQVVAEIVSIEDPRRRIEETASWRNSSAAMFYINLYQQLSERQHFQATDLLPPGAEGLLRHFRLAPRPGEAFQEALDTAARTLIREDSLSTALGRFIGLPVPLPAALIEAIAELSPDDRRVLIKRLLRTVSSPVCRIHFVYLLTLFGDETPAFRRLARWVVASLLGAEGEEEFAAFSAILKWTNHEFNRWPESRVWFPHIRLAMVWAHAHRLMTMFSSLGAPAPWLQDTFSQPSHPIPSETFERNPDYWFDIAHPRLVSRVTFLLDGLSYSLGEKAEVFIDEGLRALLAAEAFRQIDGQRLPVAPLLRNFTQTVNSLDSFLRGDRGERLSALLGPDDAGMLAQSSLQALTERTVQLLAEASNRSSAWLLLHALLGDMPPHEDLADRLKTIMRQTDFVGLFEKDTGLGYFAMQTASLQAINLGDEDLRCYLKAQLVESSRLFAGWESGEVSDGNGKDNFDKWMEVCYFLIESALNLAIAAHPLRDVIAEFVDLLTQLVETWSSMIPTCRPIVQLLTEDLPISQAQQFWPLFVRLRAE